jgi:hypothetical protein
LKIKLLVPIIVCLAVLSTLAIATAVVFPSDVWVNDQPTSSGPTDNIDTSVVGQTVWIFWDSEIDLQTLSILAPNGATENYSNLPPSGSTAFTPTMTGDYIISYLSDSTTLTVVPDLPLPESPLGALTALSAAVAAFGLVAAIKKRK